MVIVSETEAIAANLVSKTCCECYCVQPLVNTVCCLCGTEPFIWLPAAETPGNREMDSLRELAATASIDQLQTMLRSGWSAYGPERERVAKNLLVVRLREREQERMRAAYKPEPAPTRIAEQQVRDAIRSCNMRLEEINKEIEEMNARHVRDEDPEVPPAVPWYLEPEYLEEKKKREEEALL